MAKPGRDGYDQAGGSDVVFSIEKVGDEIDAGRDELAE
jgi:hypothetical protein